MATPHIAAKKEEIAPFVAMAGDPLRVKLFVEKYMKNAKLVSNVRGILVYTGEVNSKRVTVMAHGMGFGSMGIYAWELYDYYNVQQIVRFGSCGAYDKKINVLDFHVVTKAWTESNFGKAYGAKKTLSSDKEMAEKAIEFANKRVNKNRNIITGIVHSTPLFYRSHDLVDIPEMVKKGIKTVEMESYSLYAIANHFNRKALTVLTVSDHLVDNSQNLKSDERRTAFTDMFDVIADIIGYYG